MNIISDKELEAMLAYLEMKVPELNRGTILTADQANSLLAKINPIAEKLIELNHQIYSAWQ